MSCPITRCRFAFGDKYDIIADMIETVLRTPVLPATVDLDDGNVFVHARAHRQYELCQLKPGKLEQLLTVSLHQAETGCEFSVTRVKNDFVSRYGHAI